MRLFQNRLKAESGRTLLEMLGVLSIISVLTIGGLAGYQALTLRFETRTVSETIMRHVVERQHEAMTKKGKIAHQKLDVEGPHGVSFDISNDIVNQLVVIKIKAAKPDLIQSLLKSDVLKADAYSMDTPTLTEGASSVVMRFKQFPQTELVADSAITCSAGEECAQCTNEHKPNWDGVQCVCTANSCGEGYICANGECLPCTEVENYKADGSGMMDEGTVCCPNGYDTAVGGMCCLTDAPYCKEVNYLESSGSQWIDTDFIPVQDDLRIIYEAQVTTMGENMVMGCYNKYSYTLNMNLYASDRPYFRFRGIDRSFSGYNLSIKHKYEIGNVFKIDDVVINTPAFSDTLVGNDGKLTIFGRANSADPTDADYKFRGKIFNFKCYYGENLVRDFIPVIDQVGKAGMYDRVSKTFFENQGSGHFIAG